MLRALSLLIHCWLIADIELRRAAAKLIVMPPPCLLSIAPIDFAHAPELMEHPNDARVFLDGGGAERPPTRMHMDRQGQRQAVVRIAPRAALTDHVSG